MSKIMTAKEYQDKWETDSGYSAGNEPYVFARDYAKYYAQSLIDGLTGEEAEKATDNYDANQYDGVLKARQYYLNRLNQEG